MEALRALEEVGEALVGVGGDIWATCVPLPRPAVELLR